MADRYWVGGSGTWNNTATTNWSATSGGASGASAPTSADNVIFNSASNATAYTVTMGTSAVCADMTMAGPASGNVTWAGSTALSIYGSMTLSATGITRTYTGIITFAATTTGKTVTTNGVSFDANFIFSGVGGSWQLVDNLTTASTRTVFLDNGTLDINGKILTCGFFGSNNANIRTIAFGVGNITLTGSGTYIWATDSVTNLTVTGTPVVNCSYSGSVGTRSIAVATFVSEAKLFSFKITAGTDIVSFSSSNGAVLNVDFTGFSGTHSLAVNQTLYGNLTLSTGMTAASGASVMTFAATSGTKTITSNGKTLDFPITFNGVGGTWQLADALTVGSTRTVTLTAGTLDLNSKTLTTGLFNSNNSNTRTLAFGTGNITLTGNNATIWQMASGGTGFSVTGTPVVNCTYSGGTGTRTISLGSSTAANTVSFNTTAATDIVSFNVASGTARNITFTGFTGTFINANTYVYGSMTLSAGMTTTSSTSWISFSGTSGPYTITTAGVTVGFPVYFQGSGGSWQFADNFAGDSARYIQLDQGTISAGANNITTGIFVSSGSSTRAINFGSGTWTIAAASVAVLPGTPAWSCATSTNMTTTPGTATISMTAATAKTFAGGGKTYPKLNQGGAGSLTITGANTFADMTATTVPSTIIFPASTTTTTTLFSVSGTAGNLATLNSSTAGTRATLSSSQSIVGSDYLNIKDISATGTATWYAGANSTNSGNNLGWIFTAVPLGNFFIYFN